MKLVQRLNSGIMSNIKIIYVDDTVNHEEFYNLLKKYTLSVFRIIPILYLVKYDGEPVALYNSLMDIVSGKNIFIQDIDTNGNTFWGYMRKDLWEWINDNYGKEK